MNKIEQAKLSLQSISNELDKMGVGDSSHIWAYIEDISDVLFDKAQAAAPDLLAERDALKALNAEMLEGLLGATKTMQAMYPLLNYEQTVCFDKARAAIAKATKGAL